MQMLLPFVEAGRDPYWNVSWGSDFKGELADGDY